MIHCKRLFMPEVKTDLQRCECDLLLWISWKPLDFLYKPVYAEYTMNSTQLIPFLCLLEGIAFLTQTQILNPHICATEWINPLIFQTENILTNRIHSLKYLRFTRLGCKDIRIRKSEFMAKNQFLSECYVLRWKLLCVDKIQKKIFLFILESIYLRLQSL